MRRTTIKRKLILFFVLAILFVSGLLAQGAWKSSKEVNGELRILATPHANVFINNVNKGSTPYDVQIPAGTYTIKLIPDQEATVTASWQSKVTVERGALSYVNRDLGTSDVDSSGEVYVLEKMSGFAKKGIGEVVIETEPVGSLVSLDSDEKGIAPLTLADVPEGSHELSIYLPGFFRRTQTVNVVSGYRMKASVKLAIDEAAQIAQKRREEKKASNEAALAEKNASAEAQATASANAPSAFDTITITGTPNGFLRVRKEPNLNSEEVAQVLEGKRYSVLEEVGGWVRIPYDETHEGWVSAQYTTKE